MIFLWILLTLCVLIFLSHVLFHDLSAGAWRITWLIMCHTYSLIQIGTRILIRCVVYLFNFIPRTNVLRGGYYCLVIVTLVFSSSADCIEYWNALESWSVCSSLCHSVTFRFHTVTRKHIAVCSRNFCRFVYHVMGVCCIVFDIDWMLFEFFINFWNIEKYPFTVHKWMKSGTYSNSNTHCCIFSKLCMSNGCDL